MMLWSGLAAAGAAIWLCILVLPWQPWRVRERLEPETAGDGAETGLADVTVLIPARDEAAVIGDTLAALGRQGRGLRVILVDDRSGDGTAEVARRAATESLNLDVYAGEPLADGWTGKLWALEQGRRHVETPLILLLDADITLRPGMVRALLARKEESGAALVSVMAALRMQRGWERAPAARLHLLLPPALSVPPGEQAEPVGRRGGGRLRADGNGRARQDRRLRRHPGRAHRRLRAGAGGEERRVANLGGASPPAR